MYLYNTLSGKKESIKKSKKPLRLFVCGPTVYDTPHIGNYRTFLPFDSFVRYMRSQGYSITYLQNITDIDDKIIIRAQQDKKSWKQIAQIYERAYHQGEKKLNIISVSTYARATKHIPQIVEQIQTLLKKGYAYKIENDGYYFDITKFKDYGKLSHRNAQMAGDATSRIDESVQKRNKGDFALWKLLRTQINAEKKKIYSVKVVDGEPAWNTELGWGRPGWHIEDTAITEEYFGPQYDIHGGASELKFPHHEAEIAQQEAASGKKPLVKLWMHTGILLVNGQKMSKSLKNFITLDDFLKQYDASILRYIILSHHYRSPIDYTEELVLQSVNALESIQQFIWKLNLIQTTNSKQKDQLKIKNIIKNTEKKFHEVLADDFNTPQALATIFSFMTLLESQLASITNTNAIKIQSTIIELLDLLGLKLTRQAKIPSIITRLCAKREKHRTYKQFIQADALRNEIYKLGYNIEDTPWGAFVRPTNIFVKHKK